MRFVPTRRPRHVPCIELVELVTDYLEGTLPAAEVRALEHHLSLCDPCVGYVEQMRETIRLGGSLRISDVPAEGVDDLTAMFRRYQAERTAPPDSS
jgi:anti-sigma factor RsiW